MGKRYGTEKIQVGIVTDKLSFEVHHLECDTMHIESPTSFEAWELDSYHLSRDETTGEPLQLISERNKKPLRVFRDRPLITGRAIETIAAQQFDERMTIIQERNQKQSMLLWLGIIAVLMAIIIGIIVLSNL